MVMTKPNNNDVDTLTSYSDAYEEMGENKSGKKIKMLQTYIYIIT